MITLLFIATLGALPACSQTSDESRSTRRAISQSQAVASDFLRTELALSPETASRLGLERFLDPNQTAAFEPGLGMIVERVTRGWAEKT
ncbi:MAG: hypothetical protein AAFW60_07125, partial [Pseudomonadota bacterium]